MLAVFPLLRPHAKRQWLLRPGAGLECACTGARRVPYLILANAIKNGTVGIAQQNIYNSGFAEIYPPLLAVFIIFLVCLYSGKI